jgi:hypothetical protein
MGVPWIGRSISSSSSGLSGRRILFFEDAASGSMPTPFCSATTVSRPPAVLLGDLIIVVEVLTRIVLARCGVMETLAAVFAEAVVTKLSSKSILSGSSSSILWSSIVLGALSPLHGSSQIYCGHGVPLLELLIDDEPRVTMKPLSAMLALAVAEVEFGLIMLTPGPFATISKTPPFVGLGNVPSENELVPSEFLACLELKGETCDR